MATYGGGVTFSETTSFTDISGASVSAVVYTVPAGAYAYFFPLSIACVGATTGGSGNGFFQVQSSNGTGGWVTPGGFLATAAVTNTNGFATPVTNGSWAASTDPYKPFLLSAGQRVYVNNDAGATDTFRYSYTVQEFTAST